MEVPQLGGPLGLAAAAVGWSRVRTRVHYPGDVIAGLAMGAAIAYATKRWWPLSPDAPATVRPVRNRRPVTDMDGTGLTVVANPSAGTSRRSDVIEVLRGELPAATVTVLDEGVELVAALEMAATSDAIGIVGGDGSINAAAAVALRAGKPLAVFPGGTLNHFARDLGLEGAEDTVDAIRATSLGKVDVGMIDGHPFLNTASFGSYAELVDLREQHEERFGKWPAMAFALVETLRRAKPLDVTIDGTRRSIWLIFIGNCEYGPAGLAPSWRERLDDGVFDVRWAEDTGRFSRARVIAAALTGQLGRAKTYQRALVGSMTVESHSGPLRMARDGETFDGAPSFTVEKNTSRLVTYVPPPD
jgi:diacylglycerol kinase family enzyme